MRRASTVTGQSRHGEQREEAILVTKLKPVNRAAVCAIAAMTSMAAHAGPYIGVSASASSYDVNYSKAVDNTDPRNVSASAGRIVRASQAADSATWDIGLLAGYRLPVAVFYLDVEGDLVLHQGSVSAVPRGFGHFPGPQPTR